MAGPSIPNLYTLCQSVGFWSQSVGLSVCPSVGLSVDSLTGLDMAYAWYRGYVCRISVGLCRFLSVDNCRSTCRAVGLLSGYCRDSLSVCRTGAQVKITSQGGRTTQSSEYANPVQYRSIYSKKYQVHSCVHVCVIIRCYRRDGPAKALSPHIDTVSGDPWDWSLIP